MAALAAVLGICAPAHADTVIATATGIVTTGLGEQEG
jgi:hypothetical protein